MNSFVIVASRELRIDVEKLGKAMEAKMPTMAITTTSSTNVTPRLVRY